MKRFWHNWLTIVAVATMVSTASAQSGSRVAPEIGSYQSILSRAGYGDMNPGVSYAQPPQHGCATGNCGGATVPPAAGYGYQGGASAGGYGAPMQQQFANTSGPMYSSGDPVVSSVEMPYAGPVSGGGCSSGGCGSPVYSAPVYEAPAIYSPGSSIGGIGAIAGQARGCGSNMVASVSALGFIRDYEDRRLISRNPAGDLLFTNEADHDTIGGVDFVLANRKNNGNGWEARYFGLYPDTADATLTGAAVSAVGLRGFDRLVFSNAALDTYFAAGTSQTVSRDTDIHNLEFNLLRNGGRFCTRRGRQGNFELIGGFRYFQFDERFTFSTADGTTPIDYRLNAENTLLGLQVGSRGEVCITKRIRLAGAIRTGIFNNHVNTRQRISDPTDTVFATVPTAGDVNFDYGDTQNDVAILSEIDFGVILQLSCRARLRVGYRALGVAGVALATDQIPFEFDNTLATQRANTNGDLLLHGAYAGTEFCF